MNLHELRAQKGDPLKSCTQKACHNTVSVMTIRTWTHEIKPDYKKSKLYMLHILTIPASLQFFVRMILGIIENSVYSKRKKRGSLLREENQNALKRGKDCHMFAISVVYNFVVSYNPCYPF